MAAADSWDVKVMQSTDKEWSARTDREKVLFVTIQFLKAVAALGLLYLFIIALSLMGNAFKILGGPSAGEVFRNNDIFDNPFAGCSLGVLATVLVQSSSTSTSIIISMTAAGLMMPQNAMYMIMGANMGTSVTNTIVSVSHIGNVDEYRRGFAGATVHDCFNLLTVAILLPLEYLTHILYHIGSGIVDAAGIEEDQDAGAKVDFIKKITKPVTSRLVSVDKKLVTSVAREDDPDNLEVLLRTSMLKNKASNTNNMFHDTPLSDQGAGWLLLFISLVLLSCTLILLVKVLQSVFRGRAAIWMQGLLNLEFKSVPFVADYILILFGVGITILMQSSSVTTSTLTPLVAVGLIKLEKMFPFTVGANIGTTVTGILSALAGSNIATGMTVALGHLFFNIIGTVIWFPIPFTRAVPLSMAKGLGSLAAEMRWFPLAYIFVMFGAIPGLLLGLSLAHWAALVFVGLPAILLLVAVSCIFGLRAQRPGVLPRVLRRNFPWLPPSMQCKEGEDAMTSLPPSMQCKEGEDAATSLPPSMQCKEGGDAEQQKAQAESSGIGNTDLISDSAWSLSPVAYGLVWYATLLLLMAVPNAKWGDMKYASWDKRVSVGLGGWSACSTMFQEDVDWADAPYTGITTTEDAYTTACFGDLMVECQGNTDFSSTPGANTVYQDSWKNCGAATTEDWLAKCKTRTGCGGLHEQQCTNVSAAVTRDYTKDYSATGTKWTAPSDPERECSRFIGSKYVCCIPLDTLCTDVGGVSAAGALGTAGTVFCFLGLVPLLAYAFLSESRDMSKALLISALIFGLTWVLLLASWASMASALGSETTCYVQDDQNDGIVAATGKLGDIANGGSYGFGFVIGAWSLLSVALVVIVARVVNDMKNGSSCPNKGVPATKDGDGQADAQAAL